MQSLFLHFFPVSLLCKDGQYVSILCVSAKSQIPQFYTNKAVCSTHTEHYTEQKHASLPPCRNGVMYVIAKKRGN